MLPLDIYYEIAEQSDFLTKVRLRQVSKEIRKRVKIRDIPDEYGRLVNEEVVKSLPDLEPPSFKDDPHYFRLKREYMYHYGWSWGKIYYEENLNKKKYYNQYPMECDNIHKKRKLFYEPDLDLELPDIKELSLEPYPSHPPQQEENMINGLLDRLIDLEEKVNELKTDNLYLKDEIMKLKGESGFFDTYIS